MRRRRALGVLLVAWLAGCGPGTPATPAATAPGVPEALRELPTTTIRLGDTSLFVAVAETTDARRRGLMGVDDLGTLDGLLFTYPGPVVTTFHMRGVPIPLDIAFFDADGRLLDVVRMAVCTTDSCPSYEAPGPLRWAIETEAGGLSGLPGDARLSLAP